MGIYDREYYRDDQPKGFYWVGERTMVTNLIIVNVLMYLIDMFFSTDHNITTTLALKSDLFRDPGNWKYGWQVFTYGLVHSPMRQPGDLMHILLNMYALFLFGRDVETRYGRFELLRFYIVAIVIGGLVWALRHTITPGNAQVVGASGAVVAVMVLYCLTYPRKMLSLLGLIPIPAWLLGVIFVGMDLLRALNDGATNVAWEVHLAGAGFAFLYFRLQWNFGRLVPRRLAAGWLKPKPSIRVHRPDADDEDDDDYYERLDRRADELLDKVHREGEDSLSSEERQILEDYSRRMRQKHR